MTPALPDGSAAGVCGRDGARSASTGSDRRAALAAPAADGPKLGAADGFRAALGAVVAVGTSPSHPTTNRRPTAVPAGAMAPRGAAPGGVLVAPVEAAAGDVAAPGTQGPLGKNARTAAIAGQGRDPKRSEKYTALRALVKLTTLPRVAKCKRVSRIEGGEVHLRHGQKASMAGLVTCGSVWVCPVCSAVIAAQRAQELDKLVHWNADRGGSLALLTLTARHDRGQRLRDLRKGIAAAWRHVVSSRAWKETRKELGLDGYVRAVEVTDGKNGWHPHYHLLLVFTGPITDADAARLESDVWDCWSRGLAREGLDAIREHAVDVRRGEDALEKLGRYLTKVVFEVVGGRWKKSRPGSRTPFEILADALATELAADVERWWQWEGDSKGMRQLTWSRGLKGRVGVDDVTDEELSERIAPGSTIARLPRPTWAQVWREGQERLLDATEQGGPDGAYEWLRARDLGFVPVVDGLNGEDVADEPTERVAERLRAGAGQARRNEAVAELLDRVEARTVQPVRELAAVEPGEAGDETAHDPLPAHWVAGTTVEVEPRGTQPEDVALLIAWQRARAAGEPWDGPDPI